MYGQNRRLSLRKYIYACIYESLMALSGHQESRRREAGERS